MAIESTTPRSKPSWEPPLAELPPDVSVALSPIFGLLFGMPSPTLREDRRVNYSVS